MKDRKGKAIVSGHMENSYAQNKHNKNDLFVFVHATSSVCKIPLLCHFAVRNFVSLYFLHYAT